MLGLCHEYICLGKTIFISWSLDAASRSKPRFQKPTGTSIGPWIFVFGGRGAYKQQQYNERIAAND